MTLAPILQERWEDKDAEYLPASSKQAVPGATISVNAHGSPSTPSTVRSLLASLCSWSLHSAHQYAI